MDPYKHVLHTFLHGSKYMCIQWARAHMPDDDVNIRIKRDTWRRLHNRKGPGDSFDDVIRRLLDEADEGNSMTPAITTTPATSD